MSDPQSLLYRPSSVKEWSRSNSREFGENDAVVNIKLENFEFKSSLFLLSIHFEVGQEGKQITQGGETRKRGDSLDSRERQGDTVSYDEKFSVELFNEFRYTIKYFKLVFKNKYN